VKNKYRIVRDDYAGYEAQVRFWYFPFWWFQLDATGRGCGVNTGPTVEYAREVVQRHKSGPFPPPDDYYVVEYLD
jgi:hypothetical protein